MNAALQLLQKNKSVQERAEAFSVSIQRSIQKDVIDVLVERKEKIQDQLFELKDFTLATNLNQGLRQMTKEESEKRFKDIIELEYQLELLEAELKVKQASFDKYFKTEVEDTPVKRKAKKAKVVETKIEDDGE